MLEEWRPPRGGGPDLRRSGGASTYNPPGGCPIVPGSGRPIMAAWARIKGPAAPPEPPTSCPWDPLRGTWKSQKSCDFDGKSQNNCSMIRKYPVLSMTQFFPVLAK